MDAPKLSRQTAVITGAGSGIGRTTALLFADHGASVLCHDLGEESSAATAQAITDAGGTAQSFACDVRDAAAMEAMYEVADEMGPVRVLMTCAGVAAVPGDGGDGTGRVSIGELVPEGFMTMLEIHVGGMLHAVKPAVARMQAEGEGGSIITLSSIAGLMGFGATPYSTAKGAILGFTRALAREVAPSGIRVNSIAPGVIETPMTDKVKDEDIAMLKMVTPLGRTGTAMEIAKTALYLASDDGSFTTGQWLSPNGGLHIA